MRIQGHILKYIAKNQCEHILLSDASHLYVIIDSVKIFAQILCKILNIINLDAKIKLQSKRIGRLSDYIININGRKLK